jgi:hypothetical protein
MRRSVILLAGLLLPALGAAAQQRVVLAGAEGGLYSVEASGALVNRLPGSPVRKLIRTRDEWVILNDDGIYASADLAVWEDRRAGLPTRNLKVFKDNQKSFISQVQQIKDLEACPQDGSILVCATKNGVFLTRDAGRSWKGVGMPSPLTSGIKAVAAALFPNADGTRSLVLFCGHSIYGFSYLLADRKGAAWTELNTGLEKLETSEHPDEIADILVIPNKDDRESPRVCAAQSFRRRLYLLDWQKKRFSLLWHDAEGRGGIDSLAASADGERVLFLVSGQALDLALPQPGVEAPPPAPVSRGDLAALCAAPLDAPAVGSPLCVSLSDERGGADGSLILSELWLLGEPLERSEAANREGIYLPVQFALDEKRFASIITLIKNHALNMVVIDMKDDFGRLRFKPKRESLAGWGRVFQPVDIDAFLTQMKALGVYTAARIVAFKDPELAKKNKAAYAVWDRTTGAPWRGYELKEGEKVINAEQWVDPYCEKVWDYNAELAAELHERGFDEIQFDYIRFPTDGRNLRDAQYRWRDAGMDNDSAIVSFLRHVRERVDAPISVDIYGANGWYRTSARTGQEVELLAPLVDVICPMYYPSHFEQGFLAQAPAVDRPYRIYYQGVERTRIIARRQVLVRPYVQAFYLKVSYDVKYYNKTYVQREVDGARAAGRGGFTYWNNSGRYEDIP